MMDGQLNTGYAHPRSLTGRSVIVTGAARGVGKGIAGALLERGASVLLVDNRVDVLEATVDEFASEGWPSEFLVADLRDPTSPAAIVDAAVTKIGSVHALVNNAIATNEPKPLVDIDIDIDADDYDLVFDVGPRAGPRRRSAACPRPPRWNGAVTTSTST